MPIYPYYCHDCSYDFEIAKQLASIDNVESCGRCHSTKTERMIAVTNFDKSSVFEPYYEPGLGTVIRSKSQKSQVMKKLNVEEIGNTSPEQMFKDLEAPREKRIAQSWEQL